eukprot:4810158-Alexandrium_andersonii.AAC.1
MSASLVGSEMCIRDSANSERAREEPRRATVGATREPVAADVPRVAGPEAVSYTHLTLPTICSV